jgi:hypothetical protein
MHSYVSLSTGAWSEFTHNQFDKVSNYFNSMLLRTSDDIINMSDYEQHY